MFVPSLVKRDTLLGTGYLPGGEDDLYKTQDTDYLAGTAEVATMELFFRQSFAEKGFTKKGSRIFSGIPKRSGKL